LILFSPSFFLAEIEKKLSILNFESIGTSKSLDADPDLPTKIIQSKELKQILSIDEIKLFKKLQKIISEINKITNLTRLIDGDEYWISQVYDSIWPFLKNSEKIFDGKKFIDIGSGCGFPGLAYSITHPNSEVYLVDSSRKKTEALKV